MRNPGRIFKTDKGNYCIAYGKEQHPEFIVIQKAYVHYFTDELCTKPLLDASGKKTVGLELYDKLIFIGYVN